MAAVELPDGPVLRLTTSFYVGRPARQTGSLEFHGDDGSLALGSFQDFDASVEVAPYGETFAPVALVRPGYRGIAWARGVAEMAAAIGDALAAEQHVAADDAEGARGAIHRLLGRLAEMMLSDDSDDWTLFILREQMRPTEAFERLYGGVMGQMVRTLTELICIAARRADRRSAYHFGSLGS